VHRLPFVAAGLKAGSFLYRAKSTRKIPNRDVTANTYAALAGHVLSAALPTFVVAGLQTVSFPSNFSVRFLPLVIPAGIAAAFAARSRGIAAPSPREENLLSFAC
jgi:hypothetical protein